MNSTIKSVVFGLLGIIAASIPAMATTTEYATRADFNAAVGSTALINFEAQYPSGTDPNAPPYWVNSMTIGDVRFSNNNDPSTTGVLWVLPNAYYSTTFDSHYLFPEGSFLTITFAHPVYAAGMDIGFVAPLEITASDVTITLSTGYTFTMSLPQVAGTSLAPAFFGISSDVPFTSIALSDVTPGVRGLGIDNFSYTGVPDAGSTLTLLGGAFGMLALFVLRHRK